MKMLKTLLAVLFVASLLTNDLHAAEAKKEQKTESTKTGSKKTSPKSKHDTYPLYGKVVAITSRTLTIIRSDEADAGTTKYNLNASVEYVNGEKPATFEDVKVGSWVGGSVKKNEGDGNDTMLKLNIGVKQKSDTKPSKPSPKNKAKVSSAETK